MPSQPNQSVIHGISCLQAVVAAERPMGSREIARQLGQEHTRVSRLLSTLASIGLLEQTSSRKYQAGPALHVLAAQSLRGSRLLSYALPHLKGLLNQGMTVGLGVLWRDQICFLFHSRPGQPLEESIGRHRLHPADQSSAGLALLAQATEPPKEPLPTDRVSADPVVPIADLEGVLEGVRQLGYARLYVPAKGLLSVGIPIGSPAVAALAVSGPWTATDIPRVVQLLRATVAPLVQELSAGPTPPDNWSETLLTAEC